NVRYGSKTAIQARLAHVRSSLESRSGAPTRLGRERARIRHSRTGAVPGSEVGADQRSLTVQYRRANSRETYCQNSAIRPISPDLLEAMKIGTRFLRGLATSCAHAPIGSIICQAVGRSLPRRFGRGMELPI